MRKEDIPILYEDESCFVANKPAGITVHPAASLEQNEITLIELLAGGSPLHLVHRLDKGTTGCILIAKSEEACANLQKQFKDRSVKKTYLAICAGVPEKKEAIIDAPIGRNLVHRTKMSLFRTSSSRSAVTKYKVLSHSDECSLLQCTIETGRTHQIRVHLSSINNPILGDEKYASDKSRNLSKLYEIISPLLHAHTLEFIALETGESVKVEAPIPEVFSTATEKLSLAITN